MDDQYLLTIYLLEKSTTDDDFFGPMIKNFPQENTKRYAIELNDKELKLLEGSPRLQDIT